MSVSCLARVAAGWQQHAAKMLSGRARVVDLSRVEHGRGDPAGRRHHRSSRSALSGLLQLAGELPAQLGKVVTNLSGFLISCAMPRSGALDALSLTTTLLLFLDPLERGIRRVPVASRARSCKVADCADFG